MRIVTNDKKSIALCEWKYMTKTVRVHSPFLEILRDDWFECHSSGVTSDLKDLANILVEHIKLGSKWEPSIRKANPNFWFPQRLTSKQLCAVPLVLSLRRDTKDFPTAELCAVESKRNFQNIFWEAVIAYWRPRGVRRNTDGADGLIHTWWLQRWAVHVSVLVSENVVCELALPLESQNVLRGQGGAQ